MTLQPFKTPFIFGWILTLHLAAPLSAQDECPTKFEQRDIRNVEWSVAYAGHEYIPGTDPTTYCYILSIESGGLDLSHWILGVDARLAPAVLADPTTCLVGLK